MRTKNDRNWLERSSTIKNSQTITPSSKKKKRKFWWRFNITYYTINLNHLILGQGMMPIDYECMHGRSRAGTSTVSCVRASIVVRGANNPLLLPYLIKPEETTSRTHWHACIRGPSIALARRQNAHIRPARGRGRSWTPPRAGRPAAKRVHHI